MSERGWLRITACDNIPLREGRAVELGDRHVAIVNLGDRVLAIDSRCPHKGGPLADGIVTGAAVVCPLHAWKVSLETGAVVRPAEAGACVRTYRTRVEDGVISIEIDPDVRVAPDRESAGAGLQTRLTDVS